LSWAQPQHSITLPNLGWSKNGLDNLKIEVNCGAVLALWRSMPPSHLNTAPFTGKKNSGLAVEPWRSKGFDCRVQVQILGAAKNLVSKKV
jgi:hypothetical protein